MHPLQSKIIKMRIKWVHISNPLRTVQSTQLVWRFALVMLNHRAFLFEHTLSRLPWLPVLAFSITYLTPWGHCSMTAAHSELCAPVGMVSLHLDPKTNTGPDPPSKFLGNDRQNDSYLQHLNISLNLTTPLWDEISNFSSCHFTV
jgi:hypothetical protein